MQKCNEAFASQGQEMSGSCLVTCIEKIHVTCFACILFLKLLTTQKDNVNVTYYNNAVSVQLSVCDNMYNMNIVPVWCLACKL